MKRRGQMQLSFGMIFSIILIVAFLGFGIYAITKFVDTGESAKILDFKTRLQEDIDKAWKGSQGSQEREYILPTKIKEVCIVDFDLPFSSERYRDFQLIQYGEENLAFYPVGSASGLDSTEMNHLDLDKTTEERNPKCFPVEKGKTTITISKEFGDALVTLKGNE